MSEAITTQPTNGTAVFDQALEHIVQISNQCKNIVVTDATIEEARGMVQRGKKFINRIEDIRKDLTARHLEAQRSIKAKADELKALLETGINPLGKQIMNYELEQRKERERIAAELAEKERKQREELEAIARANAPVTEEVQQKIEEFIEVRKEVQAAAAPVKDSIKTEWTFELVDISIVPREYLKFDDVKVRAAVKAGARDIPGIRIFAEEKMNLRAK
jgi:hypothetical protein